MNTNKFSKDVIEILGFSNEEARRLGNAVIDPEHLLLGILREKQQSPDLPQQTQCGCGFCEAIHRETNQAGKDDSESR